MLSLCKVMVSPAYVALMMDKNDNLYAQNGRGRPSKEQTEQLFLHGELKDELKQRRRDMSIQNGQEILLPITIADDDMTQHVHMFPEVSLPTPIVRNVICFSWWRRMREGNVSLAMPRFFHLANCGSLLNFIAIFLSVVRVSDTVLPTPCTYRRRLCLAQLI